jgi:hypothetical protein
VSVEIEEGPNDSPPAIEHKKIQCSRSDLLFVSHVDKSPDNILVAALSLLARLRQMTDP